MSKNFPFSTGDEFSNLVLRYEKYLSGNASGYFDVEELGNIAEYYLVRGRITEALNAAEFGKRLHPESSLLDVKLAKIFLATGKAEKAYKIVQNTLENNDDEVRMLKMEILMKLGRDNEALKEAELLVEESDDEENVCFDLALIFMANGSFEPALQLLVKGEKFNPEDIDLLFEKAFCLEQLANYDEAIKTYEKIIRLDAYLAEAWFNLGQIYFNQEIYQKAIECYDYALAINDADNISMIQKAHALYQMGRYTEAIESYHEYSNSSGEKGHIMSFIGECYEKLEDFGRAYNYYKLSLEENPHDLDAIVGIAISCIEMEQYEESLKYILQAMEIDGKSADVWVYLAEAKIGLDKIDEALDAYIHSLSIDPNQPDTLMAVASIYMDKGVFDKAVKYFETAYSYDSNLEMIELFMAVAYFYTGKPERAKEFLQLAVQKNMDAEQLFYEFCPNAEI